MTWTFFLRLSQSGLSPPPHPPGASVRSAWFWAGWILPDSRGWHPETQGMACSPLLTPAPAPCHGLGPDLASLGSRTLLVKLPPAPGVGKLSGPGSWAQKPRGPAMAPSPP